VNDTIRPVQRHQINVAIHNPGPNGEEPDTSQPPDEIREVEVFTDEYGDVIEDAAELARVKALLGVEHDGK
jgi:hypothetical protein